MSKVINRSTFDQKSVKSFIKRPAGAHRAFKYLSQTLNSK